MLNFLSSKPENSKGRLFKELNNQSFRSLFQRDRDRVIYSTAFRKLSQKTQVFIDSGNDYYRTRLIHTLEVSQISRSICNTLNLDEDLSECIALAHDLGHPPFGHNGENALNDRMKNYGGFNHNEQTLRIVTKLEKKYPEFEGLNLTWESLEGIVKHNGIIKNNNLKEINKFNDIYNLNLSNSPSLEAQIASISDDVAYNNHDLDDAMRANLIDIDQIYEIQYFKNIINKIYNKYKNIEKSMLVNVIIRTSISLMIENIAKTTIEKIQKNLIKSIIDINNFPGFLAGMSGEMEENSLEIRNFLYCDVYNHKSLEDKRKKSEIVIRELFDYYQLNFSLLPLDWKNKEKFLSKERILCDYVAGMTDRYAYILHKLINE